jgi:hypothetical protein
MAATSASDTCVHHDRATSHHERLPTKMKRRELVERSDYRRMAFEIKTGRVILQEAQGLMLTSEGSGQ